MPNAWSRFTIFWSRSWQASSQSHTNQTLLSKKTDLGQQELLTLKPSCAKNLALLLKRFEPLHLSRVFGRGKNLLTLLILMFAFFFPIQEFFQGVRPHLECRKMLERLSWKPQKTNNKEINVKLAPLCTVKIAILKMLLFLKLKNFRINEEKKVHLQTQKPMPMSLKVESPTACATLSQPKLCTVHFAIDSTVTSSLESFLLNIYRCFATIFLTFVGEPGHVLRNDNLRPPVCPPSASVMKNHPL